MTKYSIVFYNIENLFDTINDPHINDDDFLPDAKKKWTKKRYKNKLRKLGISMSSIGKEEVGKTPDLIGLAEVENKKVLTDLLNTKQLKELSYDYVHFNSPDERGIDVALLYKTETFSPLHTDTFSVELFNDDGTPDYTRDILYTKGLLDDEEVNVFVNHWPSRHGGEDETEHKRLKASKTLSEAIESVKQENEQAKIIVMGDFNDGPYSKSVTQLEKSCQLFNPMRTLKSVERGSLTHSFDWYLFDQILFSYNFMEVTPDTLRFLEADIFDPKFLSVYSGKFKGEPFRTYVGKKYKGGYSDHFPVFAVLRK